MLLAFSMRLRLFYCIYCIFLAFVAFLIQLFFILSHFTRFLVEFIGFYWLLLNFTRCFYRTSIFHTYKNLKTYMHVRRWYERYQGMIIHTLSKDICPHTWRHGFKPLRWHGLAPNSLVGFAKSYG